MQDALVIHGGALGDFVMSLRVVAVLRGSGATHVSFLGPRRYADLARRGGVDEFLDLHTGGSHALFADDAVLSAALSDRLARFSVVVDMLAGPDSALRRKLLALGVPRVLSIDPRPRPGCSGPVSDQWLDDLRAAGLPAHAGPPRIDSDRARVDTARRELHQMTGTTANIALVHPGSGSPTKCWPTDFFLKVIDGLRTAKWGIAVLLGPVEEERFAPAVLSRFRSAAPTVEDRPLDPLADLLAAGDLFVGNDSGVAHLAAAVGVATIAIFGPTQSQLWRPLGPRVTVVAGTATAWPSPLDILVAIRTISGSASH